MDTSAPEYQIPSCVTWKTDLVPFHNNSFPALRPYQERCENIKLALKSPFVQPEYIEEYMLRGIPDESKMRGQLWRYCLQNLSPFLSNRAMNQYNLRKIYRQYVQEMLIDPLMVTDQQKLKDNIQQMQIHSVQIVKDLLRTATTMNFYREENEEVALLEHTFNGLIPQNLKSQNLSALFRILFIYSNLNIERYT